MTEKYISLSRLHIPVHRWDFPGFSSSRSDTEPIVRNVTLSRSTCKFAINHFSDWFGLSTGEVANFGFVVSGNVKRRQTYHRLALL